MKWGVSPDVNHHAEMNLESHAAGTEVVDTVASDEIRIVIHDRCTISSETGMNSAGFLFG